MPFMQQTTDHGRPDWLGYWDKFVQKARFKKLVCLHHIKQNNPTFLGRVCTPCLSVSTGIYEQTDKYYLYSGLKMAVAMHLQWQFFVSYVFTTSNKKKFQLILFKYCLRRKILFSVRNLLNFFQKAQITDIRNFSC